MQEVFVIDLPARLEVLHCYFRENDNILVANGRLLDELGTSAFQHVDIDFGYRTKAPSLDQYRLFVQGVGGKLDLAFWRKNNRLGETFAYQVQIHYPIIDRLELGAVETD